MPAAPFPTSSEGVTLDWLTAALGGPDALDGATVTSFDACRIGEGVGFMGVVNRLSLTYDRPSPTAPRTVITKFSSPDPGVAFFFEWSRRVCTAIEDLGAAEVMADY